MFLRVKYNDGDSWDGPVRDWSTSPDKPIVGLMVYISKRYAEYFNGHDHYSLKTTKNFVKVAQWSEGDEFGILVSIDKRDKSVSSSKFSLDSIPPAGKSLKRSGRRLAIEREKDLADEDAFNFQRRTIWRF